MTYRTWTGYQLDRYCKYKVVTNNLRFCLNYNWERIKSIITWLSSLYRRKNWNKFHILLKLLPNFFLLLWNIWAWICFIWFLRLEIITILYISSSYYEIFLIPMTNHDIRNLFTISYNISGLSEFWKGTWFNRELKRNFQG